MVLRKTVHSEIPELTRISKAAFDSDNLVGNPETGGPRTMILLPGMKV